MFRRKSRISVEVLPQLAESWHILIRQLRIWITPEDEDPWRPYVVLVFNLETGQMQKFETTPAQPNAKTLLALLTDAMQKPPRELRQKPHRPTQILIADSNLVEALAPDLENLGIKMESHPDFEGMDDVVRDLEAHMRGRPEHSGLLSVKDVTPKLAGGLFSAAAEFYRAAPWIHLTDQHTLAIQVPPEKQPRYVQVMGNGGVEYGLAMYRRWEDVERMYTFADNPFELMPPEGGHSFFFDSINLVPFDDIEAIEQYGWDVAAKNAYPIPITYNRTGEPGRPTRTDLIWYEAALRAITMVARDHLKPNRPGEFNPIDVTLNVPTHAGQISVQVKYPAGTLPKETRPVDMNDWPLFGDEEDDDELMVPFDRRAMEGFMGQFAGGFDDPDLDEAQQLMYEAWEESNPARRIILAHEALSVSANCTDAYVLLAEEEADTLGRALELYRQGVAAGERALGEDYFVENVGYFWGLLETRPYMRARQGLANTLWELKREEEALEHYRDMLRLNPGDNQGIRYSLLNLLVAMQRKDEAQTLIKQYDEDGMAEWLYTRALLEFAQSGPGRAAERALKEALETNRHVPPYLTGRKRIPVRLPGYITWGGEDEAIIYANSYLAHWRQTPGAIEWLQEHAPSSKASKKVKTKRGRGKRKK
jgi:tetratricopeptide (TPR) repeat protein